MRITAVNSRQQTILQMVIDQDQVSVTNLTKAAGVSEVTVRRDLNTLEKLSYLHRVRDFAVSLGSDDVETRMMSSYTLKRELAEFATSPVQPDETIFIGNGNSDALLTRTLGRQKKSVTIITVSSYIIHSLEDAPYEVILFGSAYQKKSRSMVGPLARQCIQQVHFNKTFIDIDGWRPETGLTGRNMMHTDVVSAVLEEECEVIVLTDSSKFGAIHSYPTGPVERFNRVITNPKICASDLMHLGHSKPAIHVVDI